MLKKLSIAVLLARADSTYKALPDATCGTRSAMRGAGRA